jgi:hypothetical protein
MTGLLRCTRTAPIVAFIASSRGNLRSQRVGSAFAIPTYGFLISTLLMIYVGSGR